MTVPQHPLVITIIILLITCLVTPLLFTLIITSWYNYILILTFLGGLLVIFIYISSLIPNEIILIKTKYILIITIVGITSFDRINQIKNSNKINLFYLNSWMILILITIILVIILKFSSEIIFNPYNPLKSK